MGFAPEQELSPLSSGHLAHGGGQNTCPGSSNGGISGYDIARRLFKPGRIEGLNSESRLHFGARLFCSQAQWFHCLAGLLGRCLYCVSPFSGERASKPPQPLIAHHPAKVQWIVRPERTTPAAAPTVGEHSAGD